jgi:Holliday junction resolvase
MNSIQITKSSGEKTSFALDNLRKSLMITGAKESLVDQIINSVIGELYQGISTKEIYNRAFALLKKNGPVYASKYKLKKAIYELGPTGFPFENFIGAILKYSGYQVKVGVVLNGSCVSHEVDVVAEKNDESILVECKFHSDEGLKCNVKIPLYIQSRFQDIRNKWPYNETKKLAQGWVVTNTRFTGDATAYGKCSGLYLLSWDFPKGDGLKDRIDRLGLYPVTVSVLLTKREKQFLLNRGVILCRQLLADKFYLDHLGVSEIRKKKILKEIKHLCDC